MTKHTVEDDEDIYRRNPKDNRPKPAPALNDDVIDIEFKKDLQRTVDKDEALERLAFWKNVHGLRDSEENLNAILAWLDVNVGGYLSGKGIDVAVANLKNALQWDAPRPVQPVVTLTSDEEVLGTLPNGERRLSLKSSPNPHTSSAAQVKDWLARYREATGQQYKIFGR
jgi:hypothetical protein